MEKRKKDQVCLLKAEVPAYGEARFVASTDTPAEFEFQAHRDYQGSDLQVTRMAPDWHPQAGFRETLGIARHISSGGSVARGQLADAMLLALRDGYVLALKAAAKHRADAQMEWQLPVIGFISAYDQFIHCAQTSLQVSWAQMSRTRIPFAVDSADLDETAQQRLRTVARFVRGDHEISTLYIDGHTDASGDKMKNRKLSAARAEVVAEFLKTQGLGQRDFVVRFHGASYPVADNATPKGKARNRRATVRLARGDTAQVAQK